MKKLTLFPLLLLGTFGPIVSTAQSRPAGACHLTRVGPTCAITALNLAGTMEIHCAAITDKCDQKGESHHEKWHEVPVYSLNQVLREEKTTDSCLVEMEYLKTCERKNICKVPYCGF